jgi:hypothetical protein
LNHDIAGLVEKYIKSINQKFMAESFRVGRRKKGGVKFKVGLENYGFCDVRLICWFWECWKIGKFRDAGKSEIQKIPANLSIFFTIQT